MNNLQLSLELARLRTQQLQQEAQLNRLLPAPQARARLARLLRHLADRLEPQAQPDVKHWTLKNADG
jgi:hypothetical protein